MRPTLKKIMWTVIATVVFLIPTWINLKLLSDLRSGQLGEGAAPIVRFFTHYPYLVTQGIAGFMLLLVLYLMWFGSRKRMRPAPPPAAE